jgi:hypothetical protein
VQQLRRAESEQVQQIGIEPHDTAAHARVEMRIEPSATTQHPIHELAHPTAVACVESHRPAIECRIEQLAGPQVGANLGRGDARVGYSTGARPTAVYGYTAKRMIAIRPWHIC